MWHDLDHMKLYDWNYSVEGIAQTHIALWLRLGYIRVAGVGWVALIYISRVKALDTLQLNS